MLAATLLAAALPLAGPAHAGGYDGLWNVIIITQAGSCDAAYSYPFRIAGNRITSMGSFDISGQVSGGGVVRISAGGSVANGTGRLGGGSGSGKWTARLSGGNCSGRWQATRG
jgi:uncharacterized membrane protein YgcG